MTLERILVASDLSSRSEHALARACAIAAAQQARLTLLHVVDASLVPEVRQAQTAAARTRLAAAAKKLPGLTTDQVAVEVVAGEPHAAIIATAHKRKADLVLLGMHGKAGALDLFLGTTVERVLRHGELPVLLVRQPARASYRRAVVAIDFAEPSRRALAFLLDWLPQTEVAAVHAFDVTQPRSLSGALARRDVVDRQRRDINRMLAAEILGAAGDDPERTQNVRLSLRQGKAEVVLRGAVKREKAQLLVMGTHGRTGLMRAILGSVAESLLADPPCDVLVVRGI